GNSGGPVVFGDRTVVGWIFEGIPDANQVTFAKPVSLLRAMLPAAIAALAARRRRARPSPPDRLGRLVATVATSMAGREQQQEEEEGNADDDENDVARHGKAIILRRGDLGIEEGTGSKDRLVAVGACRPGGCGASPMNDGD